MIKVLSFLSNENCFVGHSRGSCGPHVIRVPRFEHHWFKLTLTLETTIGYICNTHPLDPLSRSLRWSWNEPFVTIRPDTASWCARNSCEKRYSNWFYLQVIDYKRTDTSFYSTKSWSRIRSLGQFRWFALKYFFGLYFKDFINLKTLELGRHCPRCPPG